MNRPLIKVAAKSSPPNVAGAIANVYREQGTAVAQAIGAGAVNQMVKAMAIAVIYLGQDGLSVACIPSFVDVPDVEHELTAVRMTVVEHRDGR